MRSKKAQYAFEFLIVFAFLTLAFIFWLNSYFDIRYGIIKGGKENIVHTYGNNLAERFYLATQVNPGFEDQVVVKASVQGIALDYVYIEPRYLVIVAQGTNYYFDIPCLYVVNDDITCSYDPAPKLNIKGKTVLIKNYDFEVFLNIETCPIPCNHLTQAGCDKLC